MKKRMWLIKCRSINGFSTILALVCFGFLLQIISLMSLYIYNSAYLIQASRQSTFDLSCISHARHMIETNNLIRLCNYSTEHLIQEQQVEIMDQSVLLIDQRSFIECIANSYTLRIYYDDKGIVGIDYIN